MPATGAELRLPGVLLPPSLYPFTSKENDVEDDVKAELVWALRGGLTSGDRVVISKLIKDIHEIASTRWPATAPMLPPLEMLPDIELVKYCTAVITLATRNWGSAQRSRGIDQHMQLSSRRTATQVKCPALPARRRPEEDGRSAPTCSAARDTR